MRIGVNGRFLAAPSTGVQRFALEVARGVMANADAALLVPKGAREPRGMADGRVRRGRLRGHAWEQIELPNLARRAGCDVTLHLANAVPLRGGPHVVVIHDAAVHEHPQWFGTTYRLWHWRVLLPAARRAAAVGTVSRDAARRLAPFLGRRPEEIAVLPQGAAPIDAPASPEAVERVREAMGLTGPYCLAVGAGDPRKNLGFLLRVWETWEEDAETSLGTPPPFLVLVGDAPRRVFAGVGSVGLAAHRLVVRTGRVDDATLRALYTGATALCFPSLAEGFGRPALEALACGTPVVAAPYGPAREVLRDAAGILPLEPDRWRAELVRLFTRGPSPGFESRARAVVEAHRWEDGVREAISLCESVVGGGVRVPAGDREGGVPS